MSHPLDRHVDSVPPLVASVGTTGLRARAARLRDRCAAAATLVWLRIRHADTSTVMLVLALLIALLVLFVLSFTSVNRRH